MLTAKLICFVMIGLLGLTHNATAQESHVFIGSSPPVADSSGTLVINNDPQYDDTFQWESSDSILGEIATDSVTATRWNYLPGSPARLVFVGNSDGATFYGNVLFEPYNRAVVDVVKDSKRVRYLLKVAELNLEVQHVPDEIEEGSLGDPFTGGLIFVNNDRDDPENETQYPDYGFDTADFQGFTDASEDDDLIYVKVNVHGIPGVTGQIQVQVVQGEDKIQLWEAVDGVTPSMLVEYTGDPKTVTVSVESDELLLILEGKNASDLLNDVQLVATFNIGENSDPISQDIVTMTVNDIRNVNQQGEEVGEYTTPIPSEVLEPFSHEPGKPGGPGGFGGPPEGSGMTFLMDPYRIVGFVHTVNPDGPDTVTLTLVSNVTEDWTKVYELVEKDPNRYGNDEDFLALEILEEDTTDYMEVEKKVIEIASTEFGIIREMELFETEAASNTFRSRRLELVVTMDALPDPSVEDTLEVTVTSSFLPGEEHNDELTETGPDTYEFQSEDGTLKIVFIRFGDDEEWLGSYDVDYFTAKVTSDLLNIEEEPVDAIETAESSLEFRTDALHNTNGGEVSTGAYIAIGQKIVWFSEVEKVKPPPGTKRIRASLWYKPQGGLIAKLGIDNLKDSVFQFNLQTKRLVYPLLILEAKDNKRGARFEDNVVKCYLIPGDELWVNLEPAKKGWGCIKRTVLKVDIDAIKFDYDPAPATTTDGQNIREDENTDITPPEYKRIANPDKPCAYINGKKAKLKVKLRVQPSGAITSLKLEATGGGVLGPIAEKTINLQAAPAGDLDADGYVELQCVNAIGGGVKIDSNVKWNWHVKDLNGTGDDWCKCDTTTHKAYIVLDTPKAPMDDAWTKVLDVACHGNWAGGQNNVGSAVVAVGKALYQSSAPLPNHINYDGSRPWYSYKNTQAPDELEDGRYFHLTRFFTDIAAGNVKFSCSCVANFYEITVASIGIDGKWKALDVDPNAANLGDYIKGGTGISCNWYDSIGTPGWTESDWIFHQVFLYDGKVYDACIKSDNNNDPVNHNPVWTLGLDEATYEGLLGSYDNNATKTGDTELK